MGTARSDRQWATGIAAFIVTALLMLAGQPDAPRRDAPAAARIRPVPTVPG